MDLQLIVCSLVVLCVISTVLSQEKCPPLVEYMYSFGQYCHVYDYDSYYIMSNSFFPLLDHMYLFWCVLPCVSCHQMCVPLISGLEKAGSGGKSQD